MKNQQILSLEKKRNTLRAIKKNTAIAMSEVFRVLGYAQEELRGDTIV